MRTLLVVAHPDPDALIHGVVESFARKLQQLGGDLDLVDLYKDQFNPVADVEEFQGWRTKSVPDDIAVYQDRLRQADNLVLAYPVWWATPPAILQGWLQRVMTNGFAFTFGETGSNGLLSHKTGLLVNVGSPDESLASHYLEPIEGVLRYCGIGDIRTCVSWGVYPGIAEEKVTQALRNADKFAEEFA